MPLVFAINERSASGHHYNDQLGVSYEYPFLYRNIIQSGERFVYYRGSIDKAGARVTPVYLGVGTVGSIQPSRNSAECLTCVIVDYRPFAIPVPFKTSIGETLEPGGMAGGRYYQRGVRTISEEVFDRIEAEAARLNRSSGSDATGYSPNSTGGGSTVREVSRNDEPKSDERGYQHYSMVIQWSSADNVYIVSVPELPGCVTHGATYEEAATRGQEAIESWLMAHRAWGKAIPDPRTLG